MSVADDRHQIHMAEDAYWLLDFILENPKCLQNPDVLSDARKKNIEFKE